MAHFEPIESITIPKAKPRDKNGIAPKEEIAAKGNRIIVFEHINAFEGHTPGGRVADGIIIETDTEIHVTI